MRAYLPTNPYPRRAMALKYGGGIGRLGQEGNDTLDPSGFLDAPSGMLTNTDPIALVPSDLPTSLTPTVNYDPTVMYDMGPTPPPSLATSVVDSSGITWNCDSSGSCCDDNGNCQVGPPTPASDPANQAAATKVAALAQAAGGTYGAASAATIAAAAATQAAQIAAALSKAVTPSAGNTCPTGYVFGAVGQSIQIAPGVSTVGTGKCVPISGTPAGQWVSFATNTQIMVFAGVIIAALVVVPMLSGGGGRRRR